MIKTFYDTDTDIKTVYVCLGFGYRLIFKNGKYVGWYNCKRVGA